MHAAYYPGNINIKGAVEGASGAINNRITKRRSFRCRERERLIPQEISRKSFKYLRARRERERSKSGGGGGQKCRKRETMRIDLRTLGKHT